MQGSKNDIFLSDKSSNPYLVISCANTKSAKNCPCFRRSSISFSESIASCIKRRDSSNELIFLISLNRLFCAPISSLSLLPLHIPNTRNQSIHIKTGSKKRYRHMYFLTVAFLRLLLFGVVYICKIACGFCF